MVSHRTSSEARELMSQTPGLRYQQALDQVRSQTATAYDAWFDALRIGDIAQFDARPTWAANEWDPRMQFAVGHAADEPGSVVNVEMAANGLIVGQTGAGKTVLLAGLVLGACARYSPSRLNLILMDCKGSDTFRGFEKLSQVVGNFASLAERPDTVDGIAECITQEIERRVGLLSQHDAADIIDYRARRAAAPDRYPALPDLVVVIDEFQALTGNVRPNFRDVVRDLARVGRHAGVHLMGSGQSIDASGGLGELMDHVAFGISLRVRDAVTSRAVLGVEDAIRLPMGHGLLRQDDADPLQFRSFDILAPVPGGAVGGTGQRGALLRRLSAYTVEGAGDSPLATALAEMPQGLQYAR